jgi:hypothetical protein
MLVIFNCKGFSPYFAVGEEILDFTTTLRICLIASSVQFHHNNSTLCETHNAGSYVKEV